MKISKTPTTKKNSFIKFYRNQKRIKEVEKEQDTSKKQLFRNQLKNADMVKVIQELGKWKKNKQQRSRLQTLSKLYHSTEVITHGEDFKSSSK